MTSYLKQTERALSPAEQTILSADESCSLNFTMHCELRGLLTPVLLCGALLQVQNRHPLLRMRMVEEGMAVWFRAAGVGPIPIRLVDAPMACLSTETEYEIRTRFDWRQGPLARCVWIRHATDHATLLLTFNHVIGDGTSGTYLVRDLLKALAGEPLAALPLADSLDGHLPARAQGLLGFFGFLRMLTYKAGWYLHKGPARIVPVESKASFEQRRANVECLRFPPTFTQALAARARIERTTVHGALMAAIVLASFPEIKVSKAHIQAFSPVNMRDRFEPAIEDDIGFYVAAGFSSHSIHDGTEFWTLAREMKQGLSASVERGWPFFGLTGLGPGLMLLYRMFGGGPKGMRIVARGFQMVVGDMMGLTNIGRANVALRYGSFEVSALGFAASLSVLGSNALTAASLGDTLCINFIAMEPLISRATQSRIADRFRAILDGAVLPAPCSSSV